MYTRVLGILYLPGVSVNNRPKVAVKCNHRYGLARASAV